MADTLSIDARSNLQKAIADLQSLEKALYGTEGAGKKAGAGADSAGAKIEKQGKSAKGAAKENDELTSALNRLGGAFSAVAIGQFVKSSVDLVIKQQATINVLEATLGSAAKANEEYERLRNTTEVLGIEFFNTAQQYARFIASAVQAGTSLDSARNTFEGFLIAARGVNLSAFEVELGVRALGQIANKGVVNMEELRQQFAERVPGAMAVTAAALGITTDRLFELTEKGELTADTFFERVGPSLAKAFGPAAQKNADSMVAALARVGNAVDRIKFSFADAFAKELADAAKVASDGSKTIEQAAASIGRSIGDMAKEAGRSIPLLSTFFVTTVSGFSSMRDLVKIAVDGLVGSYLFGLSKMSQGMAIFLNALPGVPEAITKHFQKATVGLKDASDQWFSYSKSAVDSFNKSSANAQQSISELFGVTKSEVAKAAAATVADIESIDRAAKGFGRSVESSTPSLEEWGRAVEGWGRSTRDSLPEVSKVAVNVQDLIDRMKEAPGAFDDGAIAVDAFAKRMDQLNKDATLAATAINKLISEKGLKGLSAGEIASITSAIENLVKKFDFKDIPDEIKKLAETFHVSLNPEVDDLRKKFLGLDKEIENTILVAEQLLAESGGALSPAVFAKIKDEVARLIKAMDFKDIPPRLKALADAFGVSTTETKKNTEATKQASAAQRELLQEINRVTDALQRQAESSKEAAKENKEEIAELEKKFLTGLDPEELNRLNDLKDNQANLDRQAAKDAEAAADAQQLLVDASLAAGQTAEAASVQYDKAATSLLGVEQASLNARDRLLELQAAFAASGGAAGQFAVPGGSPSVPGAPQGPQGPIPPGAAPLNQGFGPNANEFQFTGLSAQGPGWGTPGVDFSNQPIDLFRALDAGVEGTDPNVIAQMLVEQWTSAADKALLEAVKETPSAAPVRIESVKQGAIGTIPNAFGVEPGPGGNAEQVIQKITNVQEAADQAGDVLVDAFESGGASMFNLGIASKDAAKEIKGVGDAVNKDFVGPIQQATTAAEGLPDGIIAAGQALEGASASGIDYTQAIKRAEGATGDLGFTAESAAGSIAAAATATESLASRAADLSDRAADGQREVANLSKERVKLLEREVILLEKINKLYGGEAVDISDIPPLS